MTCNEFMELLPLYPDQLPDEATLEALEAHAAQCNACARALAGQEDLLAQLGALDDELDVPEAFSAGWREAVRREAQREKHTGWHGWWQGLAAVAAAGTIIVLGGTAMMRGGLLPDPMQASPSPTPQAAITYLDASDESRQVLSMMMSPEVPQAAAPVDDAAPMAATGAAWDTAEDTQAAPLEAAKLDEPLMAVPRVWDGDAAPMEEVTDTFFNLGEEEAPEAEGESALAPPEMAEAPAAAMPEEAVSGAADMEETRENVVLYSGALEMEAARLDSDVETILALLGSYEGTLLDMSETSVTDEDGHATRSVTLTAQLPNGMMEGFLASAGAVGTVQGNSRVFTDVTSDYVLHEGYLRGAWENEAWLRGQLAGAQGEEAQSLADLLASNQDNADASMQKLADWDERARMAQVTLTVTQAAPTPPLARIGNFFADVGVVITRTWPWLLAALLVLSAGVAAALQTKRKKKR